MCARVSANQAWGSTAFSLAVLIRVYAMTAGQVVRALAWLGPEEAPGALHILRSKLTGTAKAELVAAAPQFPTWLAQLIGMLIYG